MFDQNKLKPDEKKFTELKLSFHEGYMCDFPLADINPDYAPFIDYDEKKWVNYTGTQSIHVWLHSQHTLVKTWQGKMTLFK